MRKPDFYLCENKGADQLRGNTAKLISAFVFSTQIVYYEYAMVSAKCFNSFSVHCIATSQTIIYMYISLLSGVGFSPALGICEISQVGTCEISQVLLVGVPGGFSWGSSVFAPPTDWSVSYELK